MVTGAFGFGDVFWFSGKERVASPFPTLSLYSEGEYGYIVELEAGINSRRLEKLSTNKTFVNILLSKYILPGNIS